MTSSNHLPESVATLSQTDAVPAAPTAATGGLDRRSFLRRAGLAAATVPAAASLLTGSSAEALTFLGQTQKEGRAMDINILNYALNLEYLEAEFYTYAVTGKGIESFNIPTSGLGTAGTTLIRSSPAVPFVTPAIYQYAAELSGDERTHVLFLQQAVSSLGGTPIARPPVDLLNSFNALAAAAGLGSSFDPFASEQNFLLASYIFEDVGVGANRGAAGFITSRAALYGASGILAIEAVHSATVRATLANLALTTAPALGTGTQLISALRSKLAGGTADKGVINPDGSTEVALVDGSGLSLSLTPRQVLNIVFGAVGATSGGFFPMGVNGNLVPF